MTFNCHLCPHECGKTRSADSGYGHCRMPSNPRIARAALHFGEEPCISGKNGSGTVFFSGCSLSCKFCQNHDISQKDFGKTISVSRLADIFKELVELGAHNINLVNPTHYALAIREALMLYKPPVPVIYNAGGYEKVSTLRTLDGLIDIYLPDYKYADNTLAKALSGISNYRETALAAIQEMLRQVGHLQLQDDLAVRGVMIRHLVLPGHTKNSIAALKDIADSFSTDIFVSLLFQYTPIHLLPERELNRTLTARECQKVFNAMCELGFENGYSQDRSSATDKYIPSFDLTGVDK